MVASRVIPLPSNINKHINFRDIRINLSKKTKLSGSGKTELSNDKNIKRTINNIGTINIKVKQNCFAVIFLANIKILTNSKQGNVFLANETKFANLFASKLNQIQQMSQEVDEHGNKCQNFQKLHQSYLKPKDFNIVIFQDKEMEQSNSKENHYLQHTLVFDSRLNDDMTTQSSSENLTVTTTSLEIWVNICLVEKCMNTTKDNLNHICLMESLCIKCYFSCKSCTSTPNTCSKCPLCDIYFYNQTCLLEHYQKKHPTLQGNKLSTCQILQCHSQTFSFHKRQRTKNNSLLQENILRHLQNHQRKVPRLLHPHPSLMQYLSRK